MEDAWKHQRDQVCDLSHHGVLCIEVEYNTLDRLSVRNEKPPSQSLLVPVPWLFPNTLVFGFALPALLSVSQTSEALQVCAGCALRILAY